MQRVVLEQRLAYHATVCPDGTPNLSPKGTTLVYDEEHLIFADIRSPQTVANLEANPAIEVNVVDVGTRRGYRFKGTGRVVEASEELLRWYSEQDPDFDLSGHVDRFVLVRVESVRELTSPAYDDGSSEQDVAGWWAERYAKQAERWLKG